MDASELIQHFLRERARLSLGSPEKLLQTVPRLENGEVVLGYPNLSPRREQVDDAGYAALLKTIRHSKASPALRAVLEEQAHRWQDFDRLSLAVYKASLNDWHGDDCKNISEAAEKLYGQLDPKILKIAQEFIDDPATYGEDALLKDEIRRALKQWAEKHFKELTEASRLIGEAKESFTDEQAKTILETALNDNEWEVVIEKVNERVVKISLLSKRIRIPKGRVFSRKRLLNLLYHEIGVHVGRSENGASHSILLRKGLADYQAFEEPLATIIGQSASGAHSTLPGAYLYAGIAMAKGLNGEPSNATEVFNYLKEKLAETHPTQSPEYIEARALGLVARIFRGFSGKCQGFANTKGARYLAYYEHVIEAIEQQHEKGKLDTWLDLVMSGKFNAFSETHLNYVNEVTGRRDR